MAAFRIRFIKWVRRPELHNAEGPFFDVYLTGEERLIRSVHVLLGWSDIQNLKHAMGLQGSQENVSCERVVIRYAIQYIERGLRENIFPNPPSDTTDNLFIERADHPLLQQLLQEKTCAYQLQEGRDLLCSAASAEDKTVHSKIGFRFIAPTSRAICHTCTLPDTDYLCSHFLHPEVHATRDSGARVVRQLVKGLCDIGRDEVQQPEQCHAGGSQCWEWLIEPMQEQLAIPASPLALPEALDFLDTAWRVAFGKRQALLRLRDTLSIAKLSQACTTRADFESQLSALADILKAMDIPDALLSKTREINKDQTLTRLLDCLQTRLEGSDYQEVERAVSTLRTVNEIRVALQHSGASRELPTSMAKLGIPYPPQWGDAWDRIRAATIEALRVIREKVLRYATESS
jgi:hypothetical protein